MVATEMLVVAALELIKIGVSAAEHAQAGDEAAARLLLASAEKRVRDAEAQWHDAARAEVEANSDVEARATLADSRDPE